MPAEESIKIKVGGREFEAEVRRWTRGDLPIIKKALTSWKGLVDSLKKYGARGTNLPELLSEAVFCICSGSVQVLQVKGGAEKGFDCYNEKTGKKQQIKGSSRVDSPSSFGPHEKFDEVYWVVIKFRDSGFEHEIYNIPRDAVINHPNFRRHVPEGRRPRFPLLDIVKEKNLQPIYRGKI